MRTFRLIKERASVWVVPLLVVLDFIWELPQNLTGLFLLIFFHGSREVLCLDGNLYRLFTWRYNTGVSLGWFQFVPKGSGTNLCSHEIGHSCQSLYLGPLYLAVVGVPSIIWAGLIHRYICPEKDYYSVFPENWADNLGCVSR